MHIDWFTIRRMTRGLWFLPALFSLFAVLVVVAAYMSSFVVSEPIAADDLPVQVSAEAVRNILDIVASSILAVTVFALSTLVNLLAHVSRSSSPRAVTLFVEDRTAQTSISVFIGAFLFSIVGIIGLSQQIYSTSGRLILFVATLVVVAAIVWALIRWVAQISVVGRMGETTSRVEEATRAALGRWSRADMEPVPEPTRGVALHATAIGFVQHIDRDSLEDVAEEADLSIHVLARPGTYVDFDSTLAIVRGSPSDRNRGTLRDAFFIGHERTFDYDPGFGLSVLAEIAVRAMSPSTGDPGTAEHVLTVQTRLLGNWAHGDYGTPPPGGSERVTIVPVDPAGLIMEAFEPVARHSAATPSVALALVRALTTLARIAPRDFGAATARLADEVSARAEATMAYVADARRVRQAAAEVGGPGPAPGPAAGDGR